MQWLSIGLLATLSFSFLNVADRKFLNHFKAHPVAYPAFATTLGTVFTFIFALFLMPDLTAISWGTIRWGFITGMFTFLESILFYKAISHGEVSKVIGFDRIKLVATISIAVLLFNEPFTYLMMLGAAAIIFGNIYSSIPKGSRLPKLDYSAYLMIMSGLIGSLNIVFSKLGVSSGEPIIVALIASGVRSVGFISLALTFYRSEVTTMRHHLKSTKARLALSVRSLASATGWTAYYYALGLGLIIQVTGIMQLRPVLVTILGAVLLGEKETSRRLLGSIIILIGALCISLKLP